MNILIVLTIVGFILIIGGRLPISRHRQLKGTIARAVGALLIVSTALFFGLVYFGPNAFSRFDVGDEAARTWSFIAATVTQGSILIYIALNLKRWSTVNQSTIARNDFSSLAEQDKGENNFGFLDAAADDDDDENTSTG